MSRRAALLAAAAAAMAPSLALGHEVLHAVDRSRAVAVRVYFAGGEALAYTQYQVFSPADPNVAYQKGRTDRAGWLAFVPDAPGPWRVRVIDGTGHGFDLEVPAADASGSSPAPGAAEPRSPSEIALRPLVGLAAIAAVFGSVYAFHRRRGRAG